MYHYGPNLRFGVSVIKGRSGQSVKKLLTYAANGDTNSVMVRIDGKELEFGGGGGKWLAQKEELPAAYGGGKATRSVWAVGDLHFVQIVRYYPSMHPIEVNGVLKRPLDNIRVHYQIENKGGKKDVHKVGMRFMLDTLIGSNDGVPFTVPGSPELVSTATDFTDPSQIPHFIQALERPDLDDPGTVAHLSLHVARFESPGRVSLTHWQGNPPYQVPMADPTGDSAVVMYWAEKQLKPGSHRDLGFGYGLGDVAAGKEKSLGVTVGGAFEENTLFSVTAYVKNPAKGQSVELKLPDGLELAAGTAKVTVPHPAKGKQMSIVTWRARR